MFTQLISIITLFISVYSNNIKPSCVTCKWYIPFINNDFGKCKLFIDETEVKKEGELAFANYKYAKQCRETKSLCGKNGELHEKISIDNDYMTIKLEKLKNIDKMLYEYNQFINFKENKKENNKESNNNIENKE